VGGDRISGAFKRALVIGAMSAIGTTWLIRQLGPTAWGGFLVSFGLLVACDMVLTRCLFIGLMLAAISIARPSKSPVALIIGGPMLALAVPVLDTLIVMKQRFNGTRTPIVRRINRMFNADRLHIHHILVERFGSIGKTIVSIWLVTVVFAASAIMTVVEGLKPYGYGIGIVGLLAMLLLRYRPAPHPPLDKLGAPSPRVAGRGEKN